MKNLLCYVMMLLICYDIISFLFLLGFTARIYDNKMHKMIPEIDLELITRYMNN